MKRFLVLFALALAMLLPAAAKADLLTFQLSQELLDFMTEAPPADDLVAGEGKFTSAGGESVQFTLSAHGPGSLSGLPAKGNVRIKIGELERRGRVECLTVTPGNNAAIEGSLDEPVVRDGRELADFFIFARDNGEPNGATADFVSIALDELPGPCGVPGVPLAGGAIEQGNIVVMNRP